MRLLCEFYDIAGQSSDRDYKARLFSRTEVSEAIRSELKDIWLIASKLVTHLSKDRNPNIFNLDVDWSLSNMLRLARMILDVSEGFEISLVSNDSEYSALIHVANVSARTELTYGMVQ